jgi:hypothetical protein
MAFVLTHDGVKMRVQVNALWPRILGKDATTILSTAFFAKGQRAVTGYLLAHEFFHVRRWKEKGFFGFLRWYATDHDTEEREAHAYGLANAPLFERWAVTIRGGA